MRSRPDGYYTQAAVIPYRSGPEGLEILLVTSRKRKRWVIPKGICEPDLSAAESAAKEAFEEAGIRGRVSGEPVGRYDYRKWGGTCRVEVFTMAVETVLDEWPEDFRDRRWLRPEEAVLRVEEAGLQRLLRSTAERLRRLEQP